MPNVTYNPETGEFHRNGNLLNSVDGSGYISFDFEGKRVGGHRVAFFLQTGKWPEGQIDHKNRIKTDNRWSNLREVTRNQNSQNANIRVDNKSGVKGVSWSNTHNKWRVRIKHNNIAYHLGYFTNLEDATKTAINFYEKNHYGGYYAES